MANDTSVGLPALWAIQEELTCVVVNTPGLKLDTLFYDTTNFLTLLPAHHPELLAIPVNDYQALGRSSPLGPLRRLRLTRTLWDQEWKVVLLLSETLG